MDKLVAMQTFMRIVEAGSLTAAADSLDTSLPTVVRTLASLERHLGVSLLKRTTRRMSLTEEGDEDPWALPPSGRRMFPLQA